MILQQNENVNIWGEDNPGTKIEINSGWGEKVKTKADSNGYWKVQLKTLVKKKVKIKFKMLKC